MLDFHDSTLPFLHAAQGAPAAPPPPPGLPQGLPMSITILPGRDDPNARQLRFAGAGSQFGRSRESAGRLH